MSYGRLRLGRYSVADGVYHVTVVTVDRVRYFTNFHAARGVVLEMRRVHHELVLESLAWVLMPDHLHWLFKLGTRCNLGNAMKIFKARSAHKLNGTLGRTGIGNS